MVRVQELVSDDTGRRAMAPGTFTPLPWTDWRLRARSLDVDGVRADYVEMGPHDFSVPPLEERSEPTVRTMLVVVLEGVSHGRIAGERLTLTPRQAALIDGRAAMSFHVPRPVRAVRLFAEHRHLPDDVLLGRAAPFARLRHTPLVTGCIGLVNGLLQVHDPDLEPRDEHVVSQPLIALLTGMLREALRDRAASADGDPAAAVDRQAQRRALIDDYVREHLADRDLRVAKIADALGVTPRTIHGAHADQGLTVAAHIRARRIAEAQRLLTIRDETPDVAALAQRVGLTRDQLTRAFKGDTGLTVVEWWRRSWLPGQD